MVTPTSTISKTVTFALVVSLRVVAVCCWVVTVIVVVNGEVVLLETESEASFQSVNDV